jgi:hypothetical protein
LSGPTTGTACDSKSAASTCDQYHIINFSDQPCSVNAAQLVLAADVECFGGADPSQCGYVLSPNRTNWTYRLGGLVLTYDACARVTQFGVDTSTSYLRLFNDVARSAPVSGPIQQDATLHGRMNLFPTSGATFSSVTLATLDLIQQTETGAKDLGTILASTELTMLSPLVSTNASNPVFDFDLFIDPAVFQAGSTYYLSCTVTLTFANTGTVKRRMLLPFSPSNNSLRAHNSASMESRHAVRANPSQGLFSQTFRLAALATAPSSSTTTLAQATTAPVVASSSSSSSVVPIAIGVAVGVAALLAIIIIVVVLLVRRRRKKEQEDASPFGRVEARSSENDLSGLQ